MTDDAPNQTRDERTAVTERDASDPPDFTIPWVPGRIWR
jgi:hypothetical protein